MPFLIIFKNFQAQIILSALIFISACSSTSGIGNVSVPDTSSSGSSFDSGSSGPSFRTRRRLDLSWGQQKIKDTPPDEIEKSGYFYFIRYYRGIQVPYLGQFGLGLGAQEARLSGENSERRQEILNRSGFFDLNYYLPMGRPSWAIGFTHRTFIGMGSDLGMKEKNQWQNMAMMGPVFEKSIGARLILGGAFLKSTRLKERSISQIPIYLGWKF